MEQQNNLLSPDAEKAGLSRRKFFGLSAGLAGLGIIATLESCHDDKNSPTPDTRVNLGSGDYGVLNYAYALEQLEAAFYTQVALTPYSGITALEQGYLNDIRDHEVAHREFFKAALSTNAIQALTPVFTSIDFTSRTSVLGTAKAFEDLGVSAYNGAGKLITDPAYLTIAGQIVSVEARHAALIRDLIANGTFADDLDMNSLDISRDPKDVLAIAGTYIKETLNADNLPTS